MPKTVREESIEITLAIKRLRVTYTSQTHAPELVTKPCLTANMVLGGHPDTCTGRDDDAYV